MLAQTRRLPMALWCHPIPQEWDSALGLRCPIFKGEQFWGGLFRRPVVLWIRDASYLW